MPLVSRRDPTRARFRVCVQQGVRTLKLDYEAEPRLSQAGQHLVVFGVSSCAAPSLRSQARIRGTF